MAELILIEHLKSKIHFIDLKSHFYACGLDESLLLRGTNDIKKVTCDRCLKIISERENLGDRN